MVLVFNSPHLLWIPLCGIASSIYNISIKSHAARAVHRIQAFSTYSSTIFEFGSEYAFFLVFTAMCFLLKIAIEVVWLPIGGLAWWYHFYINLLHDPGGRSLRQIFRDPDPIAIYPAIQDTIGEIIRSEDHVHFAQPTPQVTPSLRRIPRKRMCSPRRGTYLGTTYQVPLSSYFPTELPSAPLVHTLNDFLRYSWEEHVNAVFFNELNLILLSFWIMFGVRFVRLGLVILNICKSKLLNIFKRQRSPPSQINSSQRIHRRKRKWRKKSRWRRKSRRRKRNRGRGTTKMAFTSVFNVDEKAKNCSNNCLFDTDASFVVCDNSANTHLAAYCF